MVNTQWMDTALPVQYFQALSITHNDFVSLDGEAGCKEAGKMRLEDKDYIVQDGDIMHFRFNV